MILCDVKWIRYFLPSSAIALLAIIIFLYFGVYQGGRGCHWEGCCLVRPIEMWSPARAAPSRWAKTQKKILATKLISGVISIATSEQFKRQNLREERRDIFLSSVGVSGGPGLKWNVRGKCLWNLRWSACSADNNNQTRLGIGVTCILAIVCCSCSSSPHCTTLPKTQVNFLDLFRVFF